MVAHYKITAPAYLPTGQVDMKGYPIMDYLPPNAETGVREISYDGEPSVKWTPLDDEAREAQAKQIERVIAVREEALKYLDEKSKERPVHARTLVNLKAQLRSLTGGAAQPAAPQAQSKPGQQPQHQQNQQRR